MLALRQRLVGKRTDKKLVDNMKALESEINAMRATARTLPSEVPSIDWSYWQRAIKTPGVVDTIKQEYESKQFPTPKLVDVERFKSIWGKRVQIEKDFAADDAKALKEFEGKRDQLSEDQKTRWYWQLEDYERRYPGIKEQAVEEYLEHNLYGNEAQQKLVEMDPNEFRKALAEGRELPFPEGLPDRVGNFSRKAEAEKEAAREAERVKKITAASA